MQKNHEYNFVAPLGGMHNGVLHENDKFFLVGNNKSTPTSFAFEEGGTLLANLELGPNKIAVAGFDAPRSDSMLEYCYDDVTAQEMPGFLVEKHVANPIHLTFKDSFAIINPNIVIKNDNKCCHCVLYTNMQITGSEFAVMFGKQVWAVCMLSGMQLEVPCELQAISEYCVEVWFQYQQTGIYKFVISKNGITTPLTYMGVTFSE